MHAALSTYFHLSMPCNHVQLLPRANPSGERIVWLHSESTKTVQHMDEYYEHEPHADDIANIMQIGLHDIVIGTSVFLQL